MRRLAYTSHDSSLIPVLDAYAEPLLAASDRKPIDQTIDRIRSQSKQIPRIDGGTLAWLKANRQG